MESFIPIYRLMHFFGLALLLGGIVCSIVLLRKEEISLQGVKIAWNCMHLVAAPGLLLLLLTGILQSQAAYWEHFKGAGYMHTKVVLVFLVLILMIVDMRTQKHLLRERVEKDVLISTLKKRQTYAFGACGLIVLIMWLVSFRPF